LDEDCNNVKTTDNKYWHIDGLKEEATESTNVNIGARNEETV
jgi:Uri superfamily endonuclease